MKCCNESILARFVPPFSGFVDYVPTIPKLYWDVNSQEQTIHNLCKQLHKLVCYADYMGEKINLDHDEIEKLKAEFEEFKESGFFDYYAGQLQKWIDDNIERIFKMFIKQVYFGLTTDGYFVAYIPESWDDIQFDTGFNYELDTYGRLILRWDVSEDAKPVNQTPEINRLGIV